MAKNKALTDIYYWPRCFVLRTRDFQQEFRQKPYQRLSATIVANPSQDISLRAGQAQAMQTRLALLSPGSRRQQLSITGGDGFLFDIDITSAAYARLKPLLPFDGCAEPASDLTHKVLDYLNSWQQTTLSARDAHTIFHRVIDLLAPEPVTLNRDPRLEKILSLIDQSMRDELTVSGLATAVGLSESRLRSLAQRQLGCSLARYLRWATAWKTADLWKPGITYTEVAHAAGFHDLSHANRTFVELFGLPPSRVLKSEQIQLHRYQPDA